MNITITACLFARSHKKGVDGREGKIAVMTCGMVSPTIMQKAIMPPKALWEEVSRVFPIINDTHKAH
jgi:hypothetical protein